PFRGAQRFVIGGGGEAGALPLRAVDQLLWRDVPRVGERPRIAQRLRRDPVLAIRTVQVTTEHAERERVRTRESVEERLLLDRVALQGSHVASGNHQRAAAVVADLADAPQAIFDQASVRARVAADLIVRQLLAKRSKRALLDSPVELQRAGCR